MNSCRLGHWTPSNRMPSMGSPSGRSRGVRNWPDRLPEAGPGSQPTLEDPSGPGSQPTLGTPLDSSRFGCLAEPCTQHRCASSCGERSTTWTAHSPHFRASCLASPLALVGTAAQTSNSLAGNIRTPCSGGTGRCWTRPSWLPCPRPRAPPTCATAGPQRSGWPCLEDSRPM